MKESDGFGPSSIRRIGFAEIARLTQTVTLLMWHFLRIVMRKVVRSKGDIAAEELRRAFERLGSTYIKFGQIIASSPGLFPIGISNEFKSLLDQVNPVPHADICRVITEELGSPPDQIFARFNPEPLASASIAQVHAAWLPGGEEIAVKVQRPGIQRVMERDVRVLMLFARALERIRRTRIIQPVNIVTDFASTLAEELDFSIEARSMEQFHTNLRSFPHNNRVRVPKVFHDLTRPRVLTMERIHGYTFAELVDGGDHDFDLVDVIKRVAQAWIEAAFEHGFFHGDLHAGNLMVDLQGRAVFLDFGIMGRLTNEHRHVLRKGLPRVFSHNDFSEAAHAFYSMGAEVDPTTVDRACAELGEKLKPILSRPLAEFSFADLFVSIVQVGDRHRVQLPIGMILIAKVLLYIDRYIKQMAPDWAMMNDTGLIWFLEKETDAA